jgi:hypothetical protein
VEVEQDEAKEISKVKSGKSRAFTCGMVAGTIIGRRLTLPLLSKLRGQIESEMAIGVNHLSKISSDFSLIINIVDLV